MTQVVPEPAGPAPRAGGGCGRWLLGCGALVLIVLVVGGGAAWWFVGRPVVQVFQTLQQLEAQGSLEQRVANRAPFTPPADGLLSEAQVVRYVGAQRQMERELAGRVERLERLLPELDRAQPELVDLIWIARSYGEVLRLVVAVVGAQAEALDAQGFSAEEYLWVRWEVLRAAGVLGVAYDVDALTSAFTSEDGAFVGPPVQAPVPDANRALVEPYRQEIEETAVLALLGL